MKAGIIISWKSAKYIFLSLSRMKHAIVVLLFLGFEVSDSLSQSCPSINFTLVNFNTCCYTVQLDNTSECTPQLTLLLDFGQFNNWTVDVTNGFTGTLINANELLLTHSSGIIPFGVSSPIEFCTENADPLEIVMLYDFVCGLGESCFAEFPIITCSSQEPCTANFEYSIESNCGLFQFNGFATGTSPITYLWNFGDPGSGAANTSTLQNPTHQFSALCENYTVCHNITTADGCTASICYEIVVLELEAPVITCPPDIQVNCESDIKPSLTGFATAVDNCEADPEISYEDIEVGSYPCSYQIIRTWSVIDQCGHISTCEQIISVIDDVPPTAICGLGKGYELDPDCSFTITPQLINGGSFDNCLIQSISVTPSVVTGCGIFPVTLTVIDECGNTSSCNTEIQTGEGEPPLLQCPPSLTVVGQSQSGELCVATVSIPIPVVADNCGLPVSLINDYTNTADASGVYPLGLTTVIWTATDGCGNQTTCSFTITVTDCNNMPADTSCCAYTIHLYNEYTDFRVKKIRISTTCETRICCSDPDLWIQNENYPYYIEYLTPDGSGFPTGPNPLDVIDNDFEIWLENSTADHTIQVDWYDFSDNIISSHEIEIGCDDAFSDDEDWTLYSKERCCISDPKLFVFAVREPDDDADMPCGEFDREATECAITQSITCCGNDYCVELTPPANYTSWIWSIQKEYAPSSYTPPIVTTHSDGRATFKVPKDGSQSGRFIISLTAENVQAKTLCTGEEEVLIPYIIPDFTFRLLPCGLDVEFTPQITNFAGDVASISWSSTIDPNFPTTVTAPFIHTFPGQAIYTVTMVITDKYGCIHTVQHPVNNSRICTPSFEAKYIFCDQLCAGGIPQDIEVIFKNTSKGGSCPTTFTWDLGDGTIMNTSSSDPDSFKHTYLQVPCPTGKTYNITLTMDDAQSTTPQCGGPKVHSKPIHVSPCHVDINYIKCPNGSVIFTSNVPGIWEFPNSTSIDEEGSEAKDVNGRRSKVKVRYSTDGWYLVKFTGYCPNGGICQINEEIYIETICCVRNNTIRDDHRFTENGTRYKMKYKLSQNQYFGNTSLINIHNITAITQLKRRNSKVYNFWKNTKAGDKTAAFTGTIYTSDLNCSCNVAETVIGPNPGPHSNIYKAKTKLNKLGKYHSRKDSIISTHTVTVGAQTFTYNLMLGKVCNRFQWWVN